MTFSSTDLHTDLDLQLRELGYEICGDDDPDGWYWMLGSFNSTSVKLAFDTAAEASADAVRDLVTRTQELLAAARLVVARWDKGDLAEAVRELEVCVKTIADADADADADAHGFNDAGSAPASEADDHRLR